jgi:hypothetical protein
MALLDSLARQAGRVAGDVQVSIKRARLEGERRLLQRAHRNALESLGERTLELVRGSRLDGELLAPQIAEVESALMEIDAKAAEIDALRTTTNVPEEQAAEASGPREIGPGPNGDRRTGWEAADRFFPND